MKTRLVLLAALAAGAFAGAGGCANNSASIQVQAVCYPTEGCSSEGACDSILYGVPTLVKPTAGSGAMLVLQLQVENQLPDNADGQVRLNTNDAHVDEAYVEYDTALGEYIPPPAGTNAYIPAESTGIVLVGLVVPATLPNSEVVARVRLRGYLDDRSRFETGEFPITFFFCSSGCTVKTCAAGEDTCPPGAGSQDPVVCIPQEPVTPPAKPAP